MRRRPTPFFVLLLLAFPAFGAPACTVVDGPGRELNPGEAPLSVVTPDDVARERIDIRDVSRHIAFLASDDRRGRQTPSDGLIRSTAWIVDAFREAGLDPVGGEGGFLQYWPYERVALDTAEAVVSWEGGALEYGRDFAALPSDRGGTGPLVYLGRAEDAPDSMDVAAGRIAVTLLAGATVDAWRWPVTVRRSLITAGRAGARGVVFVLDPAFDTAAVRGLTEQLELPAAAAQPVPLFFVRRPAAAALVEGAGGDLDALESATLSGDRSPVPLDAEVEVAAPPRVTEVEVPNVVGMLRGSNLAQAEEYVLLMAHYDHLGVGEPDEDGDSIYNGADDNASGVAALLEVAEAMAALPTAPARPVLFLAVSGEEHGLLGSTWFATSPTVVLSDAVAALNMDMIGRNHPDSIAVVGYRHSTLGPFVAEVLSTSPDLGLSLAPDPGGDLFMRSDQFAFARRGIPAIHFFSGLHEDYHRPSDETHRIDHDKVVRVARLVFLTAHRLASDDVQPEWTESGRAAIGR